MAKIELIIWPSGHTESEEGSLTIYVKTKLSNPVKQCRQPAAILDGDSSVPFKVRSKANVIINC